MQSVANVTSHEEQVLGGKAEPFVFESKPCETKADVTSPAAARAETSETSSFESSPTASPADTGHGMSASVTEVIASDVAAFESSPAASHADTGYGAAEGEAQPSQPSTYESDP